MSTFSKFEWPKPPHFELQPGAEFTGHEPALVMAGYPHTITASLGVARLAAGEEGDALVARADAALYRAKEGGRNCVEMDPPARACACGTAPESAMP